MKGKEARKMQDAETGIDWEDAFQNGDYIPGGTEYPARWAERAEAFRAGGTDMRLDVAYGHGPRERLDLFLPEGSPQGLVIFVHGGYWKAMDKSLWSDLAGGHLVTRMACRDSPLSPSVASRIDRVISISGVHDLRPLRLHSMNADLRLDEAEARTESPVLLAPLPGIAVTCWTGALERPEFLRQAAILAEAWAGKTDMRPPVFAPERHHFDVIDGLREADDPLTRALLD